MPKGSARPYNRAEKMITKGLKMAQKKGAGRRQHSVPYAEGTPGGAGTFDVYPKIKTQNKKLKKKKVTSKTKMNVGGTPVKIRGGR